MRRRPACASRACQARSLLTRCQYDAVRGSCRTLLRRPDKEKAMGDTQGEGGRSPRCIALVGPSLSGKTRLFEAILARTGANGSQNGAPNTGADTSPEAREHGISVETNVAEINFLGDRFTLLDCPGSVEFRYDADCALSVADAA